MNNVRRNVERNAWDNVRISVQNIVISNVRYNVALNVWDSVCSNVHVNVLGHTQELLQEDLV